MKAKPLFIWGFFISYPLPFIRKKEKVFFILKNILYTIIFLILLITLQSLAFEKNNLTANQIQELKAKDSKAKAQAMLESIHALNQGIKQDYKKDICYL